MTVALLINGNRYEGWTQARVSMGIEQLSGAFDLTVISNIIGGPGWPVQRDDQCQLLVDGQVVISGHVDQVESGYSKTEGRVMRVAGRDKTADLIKASAEPVQEWRDVPLSKIGNDLLKAYGITANYNGGPAGNIPSHIVENSETVMDCLTRACNYQGVLPFPDGLGGLTIGVAGAGRMSTPLVNREGQTRILSGKKLDSSADQHSEYILRGGNEQWQGSDAIARGEARVKDSRIVRHTPKVVIADNAGGKQTLRQRAEHLRRVRQAKGLEYRYSVQGWTHGNQVWRPNFLIHVHDDVLPVTGELLISQVELSLDKEAGSLSDLTLVPPATYAQLADQPATATVN